MARGIIMRDLTGMVFGKLTVLRRSTEKIYGRRGWICKCACGAIILAESSGLTRGNKKSCGCYRGEYARQRRKEITHTTSVKEAIYSRSIPIDNDCWEWTGRKDKDGYGVVMLDGKNIRGHRLSYAYHNNIKLEDMKGLVVCHKCDNPSCVNPDHLFLGTVKDNAADARDKGRAFVGVLNGRAKLTKKDVLAILKDDRIHREIAKDYGVTRATISNVKRGSTWKHLFN